MKKDSLLLGVLLGILVPVLGLYFFGLIAHGRPNPIDAVSFFIEAGVFTNLVKLGALVNLPIFFIYLNFNKYKTAKGILTSTLIIALYVLVISFL